MVSATPARNEDSASKLAPPLLRLAGYPKVSCASQHSIPIYVDGNSPGSYVMAYETGATPIYDDPNSCSARLLAFRSLHLTSLLIRAGIDTSYCIPSTRIVGQGCGRGRLAPWHSRQRGTLNKRCFLISTPPGVKLKVWHWPRKGVKGRFERSKTSC